MQVRTESYDILEELVGAIGSEGIVEIKPANRSLEEF